MANTLVNIFRIKELRERIFFTVALLIVYRIGTTIPVPGINFAALQTFINSQRGGGGNPFFDYFNFFAGGAFNNMSIFALGIMPYITTSIIMNLLLLVFPTLKKISEEEGGKRKIHQYTRIGTVLVCFLQSFMTINYVAGLRQANVIAFDSIWLFNFSTIIITTTGTLVLMWLGEKITEKGVGNGISLIIFAGIVARMPSALKQLFDKVQGQQLDIPIILFILIMYVFIITLVIYEQQGQRKIPINYAKRIVGRRIYGSPNTYLPLKINPSGVIPIIFASAVLMFPQTLASMMRFEWLTNIAHYISRGTTGYMVVYSLMIIFFAYFYTQVTLNPVEIAKNIRENGGSIPGIPVNNVQTYLTRVLNRIVLPGSIFLAIIAIIPTIVINFIPDVPQSFAYLLGGTSLLIIVGVDLDTMSQIESYLRMHHQEGLTKRGKIRSRNL